MSIACGSDHDFLDRGFDANEKTIETRISIG